MDIEVFLYIVMDFNGKILVNLMVFVGFGFLLFLFLVNNFDLDGVGGGP